MALMLSVVLLMTALPAAEEAPGCGALTGEDPLSETLLPDGSVQQIHAAVPQEEFNGFDVPEYVLTAEDGILALTFAFAGMDAPCVLYLREPGN